MSDDRMRTLERAALQGDVAAAAALRAVQARSLELWSVDPQRDPVRRVLARHSSRPRWWVRGFPREFQPHGPGRGQWPGGRQRVTSMVRIRFGRWYPGAMWPALKSAGVLVTPWTLGPDGRMFDGWVTWIGSRWEAGPNGRVVRDAAAKLRMARAAT